MSLKRSSGAGRAHFGGGSDPGARLGKSELYEELKRLAQANAVFAPADVALAIGAGEPQVSRALLGLAAEGYLEKVEAGKYRALTFAEVPQAEFLKALTRASKIDSTRQRDLSEIARLKQNNDIMRSKLMAAISERDHYLSVLRKQGIEPGSPPPPPSAAAGPAPSGAVALPGQPESAVLPSGPGVTGGAVIGAPMQDQVTVPSASVDDEGDGPSAA